MTNHLAMDPKLIDIPFVGQFAVTLPLRHQTCLARDMLTTFRELDEIPSGTQTCAGKSSMELFLGKSMGYCPLPRWIAGDGISTQPPWFLFLYKLPKAHKEAQWWPHCGNRDLITHHHMEAPTNAKKKCYRNPCIAEVRSCFLTSWWQRLYVNIKPK